MGGCERAGIVTHHQQRVRHQDGEVSQPKLVVKGGSKRFGFAQVDEDLSMLSEHKEGKVEVVPQVDGLLLGVRQVGRCWRATDACSKYPTASRCAERAAARAPACRQ